MIPFAWQGFWAAYDNPHISAIGRKNRTWCFDRRHSCDRPQAGNRAKCPHRRSNLVRHEEVVRTTRRFPTQKFQATLYVNTCFAFSRKCARKCVHSQSSSLIDPESHSNLANHETAWGACYIKWRDDPDIQCSPSHSKIPGDTTHLNIWTCLACISSARSVGPAHTLINLPTSPHLCKRNWN